MTDATDHAEKLRELICGLRKQIADLQRTNTELNTLWRADRDELMRLHTRLRFYLGERADTVIATDDLAGWQANGQGG